MECVGWTILIFDAADKHVPIPAVYVSTANDDCLVQDIQGVKVLLDETGIADWTVASE